MEQPRIKIEMLGEFRVTAGEALVSGGGSRASQIWNLLQYLVAFRRKPLSQEEIIDAMWEDGTGDPAGALKNRVYRIRSAFARAGYAAAKDVILFAGGTYSWNNGLPCEVDTEQFETCCAQADDETRPTAARMALYQRAVDLYRGDFLPAASFLPWVVPLASRYHTLYTDMVCRYLALCEEERDYDRMYAVAARAASVDKFEETPHRYVLLALMGQGKQAQALSYYDYVSDLFYREMGVSLSEEMRRAYQQIAQTSQTARTDLDVLREDMREESKKAIGAFYCEYEVFKCLYRIEARGAGRRGSSTYLGLLGLTSPEGGEPPRDVLERAMEILYRCIMDSLRRSDVFSRCSASQYVLMLSPLTYEDGQVVLTRIEKNFKHQCHSRRVTLVRNLQPLIPVDEW